MLTAKQEMFVQNIVKGMSQRDAYKNSYDAQNMADGTIDSKACLLFKKEKIRARYEELIKKLEDNAIMTAQERMIWLTKVISGEEKEEIYITQDGIETKVGNKNADLSTKMKAMDILNKMDGQYITKVEGNISVEKIEDLL